MQYEIRVKGHLSERWTAWFDGLSLSLDDDGTTVIAGPVADQAALHGLLQKLRDVGIPIIALNMVGSITDHVDLVVSDPVQAGTMAVMAVAETATFDLERQRGRRY